MRGFDCVSELDQLITPTNALHQERQSKVEFFFCCIELAYLLHESTCHLTFSDILQDMKKNTDKKEIL